MVSARLKGSYLLLQGGDSFGDIGGVNGRCCQKQQ